MKNTKHSLLGFICSLFLFIFLLSSAFVISLRIGLFDANGGISIASNSALSASITDAITNNSNAILEQYGFTSDTFNELMNDDYIATVINTAGNSILSDDEIDLSSIKQDTVDFCSNTSSVIVDEFVDNLENTNGKINEATVTDDPIVQAFSKNYGVDINTELKSAIAEKYPDVDLDSNSEIDLSKIDKEELRSTLNTAVEQKISPHLDELTEKIIDKAEEVLSNVSSSVHDNSTYKLYNNMLTLISGNITLLIVFLSMCVFFFFAVQFMLYSGIHKNKPLTHLGIVSLLAAIPTIIIGYSTSIFDTIIDKLVNKINSSYSFAGEIIRDILNSCLKPFVYTGFALLIISAIAFIISIIIKPIEKEIV